MNLERVAAIKFFFGVKNDNSLEDFVEENLKHIEELTNLLVLETSNEASSGILPLPHQVYIIVPLPLFSFRQRIFFFFLIFYRGCLDQGDCKLITAFVAKILWH